jgi:hypothetical protein
MIQKWFDKHGIFCVCVWAPDCTGKTEPTLVHGAVNGDTIQFPLEDNLKNLKCLKQVVKIE